MTDTKRQRKAICSSSKRQSKRIMEAFGLSVDEWVPLSYSGSLAGYQFDKIVMFKPKNFRWRDKTILQRYCDKELIARLAPDGVWLVM